MKYDELCNKITEISGMAAEETQVEKNGTKRTGIVIGNGHVKPTLYPRDFGNIGIDEMAEKMVKIAKDHMNVSFDNVIEHLCEWEFCKDRLELCVRHKSHDTRLITQDFLDLEKYVRVRVNDEATAPVSKSMVDAWGVSQEEVFDNATVLSPKVRSMNDMMRSIIEGNGCADELDDLILPDDEMMLVVTNEKQYNGSSALVLDCFWKKLRERLGSDFFIIPSSIHELLVVATGSDSADIIKSMVRDVNDTQVAPDERLSYSVYEYKDGKIQIAA